LEASAELNMPVNLHILTGFKLQPLRAQGDSTPYKTAVNDKVNDAAILY